MAHSVWLITGTSSGLGLCLARAVLAAGHRVVATSRKPSKSPEAIAEIEVTGNGKWLQLDVMSEDLEHQVEACIKVFGRIDVLVNNAGYGAGGALEDIPFVEIRRQFETNFFGSVRTIKCLLPHMRIRGSGTIINVTSTEGYSALPALSVYAASKHALEGLSESLAGELASFGIKVFIVEPGGMRTDFLDGGNMAMTPISEPYQEGAVGYVANMIISTHGKQMQDPVRTAERIVEAVTGKGERWPQGWEKYLRLTLGKESYGRMEAKVKMLQENLKGMEIVHGTVDFDS